MKPYTRSILDLFDGKRRYLIPLYQRQYAWSVSPQLELLWEDIERAVSRLEVDRTAVTPHFMGALVISQIKTFGKQVQAFEVIDGQQRLTTFQLLLAALRDVAGKHDSAYAKEVEARIFNDGVMDTPVERYKLWPTQIDRRVFIEIVDAKPDSDLLSEHTFETGAESKPASAAYDYFRKQVEDHVVLGGAFVPARIERLFEALQSGLAAVSIELEGGDDPQTIFETLNSRGVHLSQGDLMRNLYFKEPKDLGKRQER
jgi:hypothetical protein